MTRLHPAAPLARTLRALIGIGAAVVLAVVASGCASSAPPAATPDPFAGLADRSDQAFRQGLESYGQGQYRDALTSFEQARLLSPTVDPRIDQMIERSQVALAPQATPVAPTPTDVPLAPVATPVAMSTQAPDTELGARYFGKVSLGMVPSTDTDAPPATQFFFQDQIGLHIEGLKQHLRLPFTVRVFNVDAARLVAEVQSDDVTNAPATVVATPTSLGLALAPVNPLQVAVSTPDAVTAAAVPTATPAPTDFHLVRFWDTFVWYHQGGDQPGRYRVELSANGILTNTFDYTVGSVPIPTPTPRAQVTANLEGHWTGSIVATSGPAVGQKTPCTMTMTQTGASISGPGSCDSAGSGTCTGSVSGDAFHLDCDSLSFDATLATDGVHMSGTFNASDGWAGSYEATRTAAETAAPALAPPPASPQPAAAAQSRTLSAPAAPVAPTVAPTQIPPPTPTVVPTPANAYTTVVGGVVAGLDVDSNSGRFYMADTTGVIWSSDSPSGQERPTLNTPLNIGARSPVDLAVDQSSGYLYLSTRICAPAAPGCVLVVDSRNGAVVKSISLPGAPSDLRVDSDLGLLYVGMPDRQALVEIDMRSGSVMRTIDGLPQITSLALDPVRHILYASHLAGQVTVIDARSGQVTARVSVTGAGLSSVATARGLAYAVNTATHELAVLEPSAQSVSVYPLSEEPAAVTASEDSGAVYVLSSRSNVILAIDPTNGFEIGRVLLAARSGHPALVTDSSQSLRPRMVLDVADQTVFASLPEAGSLAAVTIDELPTLANRIPFMDVPDQASADSIPGVLQPAADALPSQPGPSQTLRAQASDEQPATPADSDGEGL
jgi:hypothetical protein